MSRITEALTKLEFRSYTPGGGGEAMGIVNGKEVRIKTHINPPTFHGKGFTSQWYVDGKRVSRANLLKEVLS